jgi:hypothetical protein
MSCITFVNHLTLSCALYSVLAIGYDVDQEEPSQSFWGSTFVKRKKSNIVSKQRQATMHISPLGLLFYNYYYVIIDLCICVIGV